MSTVTTPKGFKLGKKDPVPSPFSEFKSYLTESVTPPSYAHYGGKVTTPWEMDGNGPDGSLTIAPANWPGCGDCTEVAKRNALAVANFFTGVQPVSLPSSDQVVEQYCTAQGCTPAQLFADPDKFDNGEDMTTTLTNWCKSAEYGVTLPFTAPVNVKSVVDIKTAIWLCGGLNVGIQLPQSAEDQFPNNWTWEASSPSLGGHDIFLTGFTEGYVALVTWGKLIQCTWEFLTNVLDEAHAMVMPQAVTADKTPTGLQIANWESDLANL